VLISLLYRLFRRVLGLLVRRGGGQELEIIVLRHQLAILRRGRAEAAQYPGSFEGGASHATGGLIPRQAVGLVGRCGSQPGGCSPAASPQSSGG
jgi:hypothetical protein